MKNRLKLDNRTGVVTGAGGGIGRGISIALARRGCHLALADIDATRLAQTAKLVARPGLRVSCHQIDVADAAAVATLPDSVREAHTGVDLLINNAGVAVAGTFEQVS